jgi:hypothetical protein
MNPENDTDLAIDLRSDKICISVLKKIWKISSDIKEKIMTYMILETKSLNSEL